LSRAIQNLALRLGENAAAQKAGKPLDPGHAKAIDQASHDVQDAMQKVLDHCGNYIGAAILVAAANAVIDAAAALLAAAVAI
jgi:hypothetical protein